MYGRDILCATDVVLGFKRIDHRTEAQVVVARGPTPTFSAVYRSRNRCREPPQLPRRDAIEYIRHRSRSNLMAPALLCQVSLMPIEMQPWPCRRRYRRHRASRPLRTRPHRSSPPLPCQFVCGHLPQPHPNHSCRACLCHVEILLREESRTWRGSHGLQRVFVTRPDRLVIR